MLKSLVVGFVISFGGSLPLGNLNITAMQVAARERWQQALVFSLGVVTVEVLFLCGTLSAIRWVLQHRSLFAALQWATVALLLGLGIAALVAAAKRPGEAKPAKHTGRLPRFVLGMTMSAVNPLQIPFWAGMAVQALGSGWLQDYSGAYVLFVAGAGIGTLTALLLFVYAGHRLSAFLVRHRRGVQVATGLLFLALAVWQAYVIRGANNIVH